MIFKPNIKSFIALFLYFQSRLEKIAEANRNRVILEAEALAEGLCSWIFMLVNWFIIFVKHFIQNEL